MRRTLALALALLSAWMALPMSAGADREALCASPPSGATCICSEPLQAASYSANPSDSTTSPCESFDNSGGATGSSQLASNLPAGATATRAFRFASTNADIRLPVAAPITVPSTGTVVYRKHSRWSDDADCPTSFNPGDGGENERRKIIEMEFDDDSSIEVAENQIQLQWGTGTDSDCDIFYDQVSIPTDAGPDNACSRPGVGRTVTYITGSDFELDDCRVSAGWCEFEVFVTGNLGTGNGIQTGFHARAYAAGGGLTKHLKVIHDSCNLGTPVVLSSWSAKSDQNWASNSYTQNMDAASAYEEIMYAGAWYSTTNDFTIGPATEFYSGASPPAAPAFMPWRVAP